MTTYRTKFHNHEWSEKEFDDFAEAVKYCEHIKKDYNISSVIIKEQSIWSSETLRPSLTNYESLTDKELIAELDRLIGEMSYD